MINFNTSYVKVHRLPETAFRQLYLNFNTSYVKVHRYHGRKNRRSKKHFNTSYVKVHPKVDGLMTIVAPLFQYILC